MAVRGKASLALQSTAGAVTFLLLGACAQSPSSDRGDPVYDALAPRAEVLARNTVQEALESARSKTTLSWNYIEDGSYGEITPLRTYRSSAGFYCREYVEVVNAGANGRAHRQRTACRDGDGLWKPIRS
ncbi:RT0821/Lpp0805 family surface protein [Pelagibius sp. CAU 1746]|uniref:RT0821/Lpp0805 family surface protein n=1 Tax=Pelagibius sp. CAU 1746 TaxID=3140370 RepID=UPI00325A9310